jgi:hypothetical protein
MMNLAGYIVGIMGFIILVLLICCLQLWKSTRKRGRVNVVWGEGLEAADVDNLREQVDLAMQDPNYTIVANYPIHWESVSVDLNSGLPRVAGAILRDSTAEESEDDDSVEPEPEEEEKKPPAAEPRSRYDILKKAKE